MILPVLFFLIANSSFVFSFNQFEDRPRIVVQDGHLTFVVANSKNITFKTSKNAGVSINDIDIISTLTKAHNATKLTANYESTLATYSSRLETLEDKMVGLQAGGGVSPTNVSSPVSQATVRRLNRKINNVNRIVNVLRTLILQDNCADSPCKNGATCLDLVGAYHCQCLSGWTGKDCDVDINECSLYEGTDLGCQNGGKCLNRPGTYECDCPVGFSGIHCKSRKADCLSGNAELCGHGTCVNQNGAQGYKCLCDQGWKTDGVNPACTIDVDECASNHPSCSLNPKVQCINVPGSYYCGNCPAGFSGNGYHCYDIDECAINNGGCSMNPKVTCINTHGSRVCGLCPPGYAGDGVTCTYQGVCNVNNGGCHPMARCVNNPSISSSYVECICPPGYIGNGIGPNGCVYSANAANPCHSNPCKNGNCTATTNGAYMCTCKPGYTGRNCDVIGRNPCIPNPCLNGGDCQNLAFLAYKCNCKPGFTGDLCNLEQEVCGGLVKANEGKIKYPPANYSSYRSRMSCAFTIVANETSKVLNVTFTKFDLEESPGCRNDWLEIHDGRNTAAATLGRFCGNKAPLNGSFITTHDTLYLWFRANGRIEKGGFELSWKAMPWKCGGVFSNSHGAIQSPGAPHNYPLGRDCWWRLSAPIGKRFLFTSHTFNLGPDKVCNEDLLQFFTMLDLMRDNDKFKKFCGNTIPEPFYSPGNTVLIHFHSNYKDAYPGFQMNYVAVEGIPGCGGVFSNKEGYIHSPQVDEQVTCEYKIQQPTTSKVKISFDTFDFEKEAECDDDYIEIFDGPNDNSPSIGRFCSARTPAPFASSGNSLTIVYNAIHNSKWKIKYERACLQRLTNESGTFSPSAFFDRYGAVCIYIIERPPGSIISLTLEVNGNDGWMGYSMPKCIRTYVEVRDGDNENAPLLGKYCERSSQTLSSTQNTLWLKLKLSSMYGIRDISYAFKATYTSVSTGCGGIFRNKFGHISSPALTEGTYPPELYCKWVIIAPPQNIITLSWPQFNIEHSYDCTYDYVKIFDNNTDFGNGTQVGKFCGSTAIPTLTSTSNVVTILFYSDDSVNEGAFLASYVFHDQRDVCNANYIAPAGVIKSPGYPGQYPADQQCSYKITVPYGQQIMLNVTYFDVESDTNCRYDFLEIRNGGNPSSPTISKFCGNDIPKQIWSHTNQLYIHFQSDVSKSGGGFVIYWSSTSTGCGGTLTSPSGSIISPNYPEPYNKMTECYWKIIISQGSLVNVVFTDLDLEDHPLCIADYIELYDGILLNSKSLGKFCNEFNSTIESSSNKMMVKFRSDINYQGRGFKLNYRTNCHNKVQGFRGVIESPNFPNTYPRAQNCLWEIKVPMRNKINITFSHFELENIDPSCTGDYLEIEYAESSEYPENADSEGHTYTKYGKYCGSNNPGHISLNSEDVRIHFVSDNLMSGTGFRLEWENWGCGGHITRKSGTISSPNYPKGYPKNIVCEWLIEVDYGFSVVIEFTDIDIEVTDDCDFDSIQIFNGVNDNYQQIAKLCTQKQHSLVTSTGNFMFVRFTADYSLQKHGFIANFSSEPTVCGGHLSSAEGAIFSPNYPKNYNKNETCEWLIDVHDGDSIELTFEDVDLYLSENCTKNYVKVFDGPSAAYPVLATACGLEKPNGTIRSTYNHMFVEFRSHTFITTKGFLAKYKTACGSRITTQGSGIIEMDSKQSVSCQWTIVSVDPSKHVTLTISHIHGMDFCEYYAEDNMPIKIFSGESIKSPLIMSICGSKIPKSITSDGSALTLLISESYSLAFTATYSVYDNHCGGTLIAEDGYFATPGYPNKYPSGVQCEWILHVSAGNHMTLSFNEFSIPESSNCTTDYLEIRSNNSTGPLLGYYCGNEPPSNLTNIGNLWLLFKSSKLEAGEDPVQAKGFIAEFRLSRYSELKGPRGYIYSPLYPKSVLTYETFSYKITVAVQKKVVLSFKEFDLVSDEGEETECDYVYIEVYDGVDETAPSLGKFCGLTPPDPVSASSNIMFVQVNYVNAKSSKFILEWSELDNSVNQRSGIHTNTTCGSAEAISLYGEVAQNVTSPGYPYGYAANLNCNWTFSTIPMNHIQIKFKNVNFGTVNSVFGIRCFYSDYVKVFQKQVLTNEMQLLKQICQMDQIEDPIAGTNILKLQFVSNNFMNGTGFEAMVYETCGGYLTDPTGIVSIDNSTTTENMRNRNCQWNITVGSTRKIRFTFEYMNIPKDNNNGCINYLMIRNGKFSDSPFLGTGKFCGTDLPAELETTSNNAYLKFVGRYEVSSFRLKYQEVKSSCGERIMLTPYGNTYTEISSPNYPNVPQPHIECEWTIQSPPGERLKIDFEERFDLTNSRSCQKEYIEIRDGGTEFSPSIGRFCNSAPSTQYSTDNMMFIKFFTDTDEPKNGFKAKISLGSCGGTVRGWSGDLIFSNPIGSEKEYNCTWYIVAPRDHYLELRLFKLDMSCLIGSLTIYDEYMTLNASLNTTKIKHYCGSNKTETITTSGNKAMVRYEGGHSGSFSLHFRASQSECGGIIEAESGEISSPGYPVMDYMYRLCIWRIRAPRGRRITAEFVDLDLSPGARSAEETLSFWDDAMPQPFAAFNWKSVKKVIKTSSNRLWIYFHAPNPSGHRGFKLKFSSNEPTICAGDFNQTSGSFDSPKVGNDSYACEWTHAKSSPIAKETLAIELSIVGDTKPCRFKTGIKVTGRTFFQSLAHYCSTTSKPVIVRSPLPTTTLSIFQQANRPLNVSISYNTHPCGGIITNQRGYFQSPEIQATSKSFECAWLLTVTKGERINITAIDLSLGQDCEKSFVAIYNGGLPSFPMIEKYCGDNKPQNSIISESNSLWIEYKWEKGSSGKGIKFQYEPYGGACGGTFHSSKGVMETPNYGMDYPENTECLWDLIAADGYSIQVKFTNRFYLEEAKNCENDYLEIFDYVDDKWSSLGKKCGRNTPDDVKSTSNKLRLLFRSNDKISASGFKAVWNWTCGGTFKASQKPHYIVSPGYPTAYKPNLNCVYNIIPAGDIMSVKFLDFELEDSSDCSFDNVTLGAKLTPSGKIVTNTKSYCGRDKPPYMRNRGPVVITFKTDELLPKSGFKLMYVDESCGRNVTEEGLIAYEDTSNANQDSGFYLPWMTCAWRISAPTGKTIILDIIKLELSTTICTTRSFAVYKDFDEKNSNRLAKICGKVEHQIITSESGKMLVKMVIYPKNFKGFKGYVRFTHGPSEGCGGNVNIDQTKYIVAPNLENAVCTWKLTAPKDHKIEIKFTELNLPQSCSNKNVTLTACDCSYIEMKDGQGPFGEKIEKICSDSSFSHDSRTFSSSWNTASLTLSANGRTNNLFKAEVTPKLSICGHSLFNATLTPQTLTSVNYPNGYPANTKCTYVFSTPTYSAIRLHFVDFDLINEETSKEKRTRCFGDTLTITEDPNKNMLSAGLGPQAVYNGGANPNIYMTTIGGSYNTHVFCGKEDKPFDYYSSEKVVTVSLNSLSSVTKGRGFKLEYSLAGCNRNYSELYGRIIVDKSTVNCSMYIEVPEGRTISLYFIRFFIRYTTANCTTSGLEIREQSPTGTVLSKLCGYRNPSPIFSTTNKLYLHTYDNTNSVMKYEIAYTTTAHGRGCGGEFYDTLGKFYSPMFPEPFRNDTECIWTIRGPIGLHMILKFQSFDIQGSCSQTFVDITTYSDSSAVTTRLCKDDQPSIFRSASSIEVKYSSSIHNGGAGWVAFFRAISGDLNTKDIHFTTM